MTPDNLVLAALAAFVGVLAFGIEWAIRVRNLPMWVGRKILHIGAVSACALAPLLVEELSTLFWVVAGAEVVLMVLVGSGIFFAEADNRKSWGIALFPIAYLLLLFLFEQERWLIALPMAVLALCDAMAAIAGKLLARTQYQLTGDPKSMVGSITFAITTFVLGMGWHLWAPGTLPALPFGQWAIMCGIAAVALAVAEALGSNGFDNLWVPLGAAALWRMLAAMDEASLYLMVLAVALAAVFAVGMIWKKALSADGALVAAWMGLLVIGSKGWLAIVPLAVFLGSSVLIGKMKKSHSSAADRKEGKPRDAWQVIANGGLYALLALWDADFAPLLMTISIAVSAADTWASEVGMAIRAKTYDVLRWKEVPRGLSGGISLPGTLGGLLGGITLALTGWAVFPETHTAPLVGVIACLGFGGMWLDSLLGAAIQVKYVTGTERLLSDSPLGPSVKYSGWNWVSNDMVNILSNVGMTAAGWAILHLLHLL